MPHGELEPEQPIQSQQPSQGPRAQDQVRGQMPGWIAIAGLVICPPIGLLMVGLTRWSVTTKIGLALAVLVGWIIFLVAITNREPFDIALTPILAHQPR